METFTPKQSSIFSTPKGRIASSLILTFLSWITVSPTMLIELDLDKTKVNPFLRGVILFVFFYIILTVFNFLYNKWWLKK